VDFDVATTTTIKGSIEHSKAELNHLDERKGYDENSMTKINVMGPLERERILVVGRGF
jgi:hypothetical protein